MRKFWKERHIVIVDQHERKFELLADGAEPSFLIQRRQKIKSYEYQRHEVCTGIAIRSVSVLVLYVGVFVYCRLNLLLVSDVLIGRTQQKEVCHYHCLQND